MTKVVKEKGNDRQKEKLPRKRERKVGGGRESKPQKRNIERSNTRKRKGREKERRMRSNNEL